MTSYQQAFLELIQQRDTLYVELFVIVLVSWAWYRLWLKPFFKLVLGTACLGVVLALLWGLYQLLPKD
jgi:hypothetical protein